MLWWLYTYINWKTLNKITMSSFNAMELTCSLLNAQSYLNPNDDVSSTVCQDF